MDNNKLSKLQEIFPSLPTEIFQQLLLITNGNLDKCVEILYEMTENQNEEEENEDESENEDTVEAKIRSVGTDGMVSTISPHGEYNGSCGYCHSETKSSVSFGMNSVTMTVLDYQDLIDRGWRRSGSWLYKPNLKTTCCPQYTIRLDTNEFKIDKNQRRVLNKMDKYLNTGSIRSEDMETSANVSQEEESSLNNLRAHLQQQVIEAIKSAVSNRTLPSIILDKSDKPIEELVQIKESESDKTRKLGDFNTNIAVVLSGRSKPLIKKGIVSNNDASLLSNPTLIAQKLVENLAQKNSVLISENGFINFKLNDYNRKKKSKQSETTKVESVPLHKLEVNMVRSRFTDESYAVYYKYQTIIHKDKKLTERGYKRFLVDSPLIYQPPSSPDDPPCGYGSFHQEYRLDGKLIAVGVVDVLPKCLSSVYLYYDPDYSFLSLGVYSALQEIEWVQNVHKTATLLHYYYMGYYIHSCVKMRYKGQYKPSELLCPENFEWTYLESSIPELERSKYSRLINKEPTQINQHELEELIETLPLLISGRKMKLKVTCQLCCVLTRR